MRGEGGRGPNLVYVPGIDGTGDFLLDTARRLESRFRLVRLGYRETGKPWQGVDPYQELAASIDRVVADLGITQTLSLAESFGGAVSLAWSLQARERVRGLAIVNSFAYFSRRWNLASTRRVARFLTPGIFRFARRWFAWPVLFWPRRDEEAWQRFREIEGSVFGRAYRTRLEMISGLDLRPRLGEIERPVFLYAADRDLVVSSIREGRVMLSLLPNARMTVLERTGHLALPLAEEPWVERMEEMAREAGLAG